MKKNLHILSCSALVCFSLITSKLTAQTINMTEGTMDIVSGNSPVCNDGTYSLENNYIRAFKISDYVSCTTFHVDSVHFGVDQSASFNGSQLLDINLYSLPAGSALTYANLTFIDAFNGSLNDIAAPEIENVPFSTDVSGANSLVVEIASPDGSFDHIFLMGSNTSAQTKPSYMNASACNILDITDISTLGLPTAVSLAISVYGHALDIPKPDTFTTGKNIVCNGEVVTYTVPSVTGVTYNWTYSGTGVSITGTGNSVSVGFSATATSGVLSVTASNGGLTSSPRSLTITVNPIPAPSISRAGDVLTSSIPTNCTWYRNNIAITGANSSTYTMTQNGSYFVKVTQNGCSGNSDTVQVTDISTGTGVNDINLNNIGLVVSPNPTTDILNIQSKIAVNASVFSADGKMILSVKNAKKIDMRSFNSGLYYVLFTTENGMQLKREKIVKL
ncbi:T9SS type A sorting domain-containing protein [Taibaiella lutea]|uniref:T9SS type A sorting domain-containing protein n=1 Tax=Taibaiella lutea TaxID=2608001 RepID=A0A5M6CE00_9BACT|nr:T9SS type A sorting domain-containing protein [Taibaiella lutea]KAA5533277.1 T9SS type A sorting domain-containing protein [Taibaiella lutea]